MPNSIINKAERLAAGHWFELFEHFGIKVLKGIKQVCPACQFNESFIIHHDAGVGYFTCYHCACGDGLALLCRVKNITQTIAAALVIDALSDMNLIEGNEHE